MKKRTGIWIEGIPRLLVSEPETLIISEDKLKKFVGSKQKGPISLDHSQTDIRDLASSIGYDVEISFNRFFTFRIK